MERRKQDVSLTSIPDSFQNLTLLSTPLPQAASTATKNSSWRPDLYDVSAELRAVLDDSQRAEDAAAAGRMSRLNKAIGVKDSEIASKLVDACKNAKDFQDQCAKELSKLKGANVNVNQDQPSCFNNSHLISNKGGSLHGQSSKDFEFRVPAVPKKSSAHIYSGENKGNIAESKKDNYNEVLKNVSNNLSNLIERAVEQISENDRSFASSANSSLGILSLDNLEGGLVDQQSADYELSEQDKLDLSQRLAKELNLDTSCVKESSLNISDLVSARMKEVLNYKNEENKENRMSGERHSSDSHHSIPGYSSDNSKNNTAQEFSRLSLDSIGDKDEPTKDTSTQMQMKPLSDQNSTSSKEIQERKSLDRLSQKSRGSVGSVNSNPFGDYSKWSMASDEFQSGEDVAERLCADENAWRSDMLGESKRSLSGIYGDGEISIRTHGGKLSINSFLRSGSGPLGCLGKESSEIQRPDFGNPVVSPERRSKPRAILPPPEEKASFVIDEIPTKDTTKVDPWNPQSLVEQYSLIHEQGGADVSVPSLSYIGQVLDQGLSPRTMMEKLMDAPRKHSVGGSREIKTHSLALDESCISNCGKQEKLRKIQAVTVGNNSFCRGYESDRSTRYSSSFNSNLSWDDGQPLSKPLDKTSNANQSTSSICDITDFDGGEEYVCVLTPESMDFDIFNDQPRVQHYTVKKSCYLNGVRKDSAALIHIPVTNLSLQPGERRTLSVTVAAIVGGTIKVKLEVTRFDQLTKEIEINPVFGKIIAEIPKISLLSASCVEMKPYVNGQCTELYRKYNQVVELKNNGRSIVPLKLSLSQVKCADMNVFHFSEDNNNTSVTYNLEPGQILKQTVFCQTPPIFNNSKDAEQEGAVRARLDVSLATAAQVQLSPLSTVALSARLNPNFFSAPSHLVIASDSPTLCHLYNSGLHAVMLHAAASNDFTVEPTMFTIHPHQTITLRVAFLRGSFGTVSGNLRLLAVEANVSHNIYLRGTSFISSSTSSLCTPSHSRGPSPTSPTSSSTSVVEGVLQLVCTHRQLVWGGCALQQNAVKACSLKNQSNHREKLSIRISGPHNCFKLLSEKKTLESEIKISLRPMENREISVVMHAGSIGPKWGHLIISRINSPADKKVLLLYGFGGKARAVIRGVHQDPEQRMWLYLDSDRLSTSFTLVNNGDYTAFLKITEGLIATTVTEGLSISPPEQILRPGQSVLVDINLSITPERLEYLLSRPSQAAICITKLTVTHGDESTRQRLSQMARITDKLASKLAVVNQMLPVTPIPDLDKLHDPSNCGETLWLEDVGEWTIGVLMMRSALEALRLDTSIAFVDLSNTVVHP